jgi:hypothetical protein
MRSIACAALLLAACIAGTVRAGAEADQIPAQFTNLQVLPKDITRANLVAMMRQFCFDLDVRCEHCHVGEGNDLSKFDFASDARPAKATARRMLAMVTAINTDHLKGIGDPATEPKVTCFTCHRGAAKPAGRPPR